MTGNSGFYHLRDAFLKAASEASGAVLTAWERGSEAGSVVTDVVRIGPHDSAGVIFLTSGIHGAELRAGSRVQSALLESGRLSRLPRGLAVVLVHAANPVGARLGRRHTEENIDLCRNFVDFPGPAVLPDGYDALRAAFDADPGDQAADRILADFRRTHGLPALYGAAMSGQYRDADGMGFGGHAPSRAREVLEEILRHEGRGARKIHLLDYHTGVGPYGYGSIIAMQKEADLARARAIFGPWVIAPRDNPPPGFVDVTGHTTDGYGRLFPGAEVMAQVLEVGTRPQDVFLERLIVEHRLTRRHGAFSDHPDLHAAREGLVDFFQPNDPHWWAYLLHRADQVFDQILKDFAHDA